MTGKQQPPKKVDKRKSKETIFKEGEKNKPTLLDKTKYAVGGFMDAVYANEAKNYIKDMFTQETKNTPANKDYNSSEDKTKRDKMFIQSD